MKNTQLSSKSNIFGRLFASPYTGYVILTAVLALFPVLTNAGLLRTSVLGIMGGTIIYAIAGLGLNVLLGYSGLISLGTAGFMGLGAYICAYVTGDMGMPFEIGILMAVALPVVIGIIIGLASLRIEGLYLGIVTLCIAEILRKTFDELEPITGGFSGKKAAFPTLLGSFKLDQRGTYILIVVVFLLLMIIVHNMVNGHMGRALNAMRGSQVAAQAMGISLMKYRLIAFAFATACASLSGALYVHFIKFVYPSTWTLTVSLNILAIIVIGGLRSIYGTFIGAVVVYALPDLLLKRLPIIGDMNGFAYVFSGVLIIIVVLFYPGGFVNIFSDIKKAIVKKKKKASEEVKREEEAT